MIDSIVKNIIQNELDGEITSSKAVSGGDINQAVQCLLSDGRTVFVKYHRNAPKNMFQAEAKGLKLLKKHAPNDVLIPEVLSQPDENSEALVLDWIETGNSDPKTHKQLGRGLAQIHKTSQLLFGLDHDNYIGKLPQSNSEHSTWSDFYFEERLEPQIRMAIDRGLLSKNEINLAEHIYPKLDSIYPDEPPALLHGDLWGGNYMVDQSAKPVLIDPAVYFGHREMDIAFTQLFGGFPRAFYQAYEEVYPLQPGFEERKDLGNLYPILVHTNLFGGHYARQAKMMLEKYA